VQDLERVAAAHAALIEEHAAAVGRIEELEAGRLAAERGRLEATSAAEELRGLQAAAQERAERLQAELEAADAGLRRADELLRAAEGDAAELVETRQRLLVAEEQAARLENEVWGAQQRATNSVRLLDDVRFFLPPAHYECAGGTPARKSPC
jgi:glutathione synthase/RimK-type ligase-like ATP-grasp enzyme